MNVWYGTRKERKTPTLESVRLRIEDWLAQPQIRSADHTNDKSAWRLSEPNLVVADAVGDLYEIITDLVKIRFEGDADGDRPILVALMDWTQQVRLDLPYWPRKTAASLPERRRALAALYDHVEQMTRECKRATKELLEELEALAAVGDK